MLDPRPSAVWVPVDTNSLHVFHSYTEAHLTFQAYSHKISMAPHHCVYYSKTVFFLLLCVQFHFFFTILLVRYICHNTRLQTDSRSEEHKRHCCDYKTDIQPFGR